MAYAATQHSKLLTVGIASYNVSSYLERTLTSLLVPEVMDELEVLIIDDGSTDETAAIAAHYAAQYPDTFRLVRKENGGYGSTINAAIPLARGTYYKQLDGDDWFESDNLPALFDVLRNARADLVITPFIRYFEGEERTEVVDFFKDMPEGTRDINTLSVNQVLNMHSSIFRTEILEKMPQRITENCFYTDLEYVSYPLPYVETVNVFHTPVYVYRIGREGQSISIEGIRKHYKEHEKVLWNLYAAYRAIPADKAVCRELFLMRLKVETTLHFKYLCRLEPSGEHMASLRRMIVKLKKEHPDILKEVRNYSRFTRLMVDSRALLYPVLRKMAE